MDIGDVIIALIIIAVFLISIIKKIAEAAGQVEERQEQPAEFEAPADEIQEFLRSLATGEPPQPPQAQGPERAQAAQRPQQTPAATDMREQQERARERERERERAAAARARAEDARERRAEHLRRAARARREAAAERGKTPEPARIAQKPRGLSLRQAVVWSEILRPPLALRAGGRHRPPTAER